MSKLFVPNLTYLGQRIYITLILSILLFICRWNGSRSVTSLVYRGFTSNLVHMLPHIIHHMKLCLELYLPFFLNSKIWTLVNFFSYCKVCYCISTAPTTEQGYPQSTLYSKCCVVQCIGAVGWVLWTGEYFEDKMPHYNWSVLYYITKLAQDGLCVASGILRLTNYLLPKVSVVVIEALAYWEVSCLWYARPLGSNIS